MKAKYRAKYISVSLTICAVLAGFYSTSFAIFDGDESWEYCSHTDSTGSEQCRTFGGQPPNICETDNEAGSEGQPCEWDIKTYNGCKSWAPWTCQTSTCTGSITNVTKICLTKHHWLGATEYYSCDCVAAP